jgi:ABC-type glutathione transport system ATPase component
MLRIDNISKVFCGNRGMFRKGAGIRALNGVSLEIASGEIFGLIGRSGSGKTTLGLLVSGIEKPSSGEISLSVAQDLSPVQMVFQDPRDSLNPRMRAFDIIAEPLVVRKLPQEVIQGRVKQVADKVALRQELLSRYPHQLSGGERQRAAIARAVIGSPRLIVADEPTSMLDPTVSREILRLVLRLNRKDGVTFLFISHDLAEAACICSRIGIMHNGELVEMGAVEDVLLSPAHEETRRLVAAARERELAIAGRFARDKRGDSRRPS